MPKSNKEWIDEEIINCKFKDERLEKRFHKILGQLADGLGESIPFGCQDWANTKAAYRFFSNERVSELEILRGHFDSTRDRFLATDGPILILHDTTEFSYQRGDRQTLGKITTTPSYRAPSRVHTVCGLLMHSSLVVTTKGLPLGLASIKYWTRKKFKGCNRLKKKVNPTRVPIEKKESIRWIENLKQSTSLLSEPGRCIHIGDRESDIYELFCASQEMQTHFLVRSCVDRLAQDGTITIAEKMEEVPVKGLHRIQVKDKKGKISEALIEIKYHRIRVLPPIGKQKQYPELILTVIFAQERGRPKDRDKIDWKLLTDLPVNSRPEAIEKLEWYALRWKIEIFHKILKSGCKAEESKLRTAERLVKLIAVFCILSWRIFWLTMLNRAEPDAPVILALTKTEISILDQIVSEKNESKKKSISKYLIKLAKLGGYLGRANDSPPGNLVIWRGLARLTDIELGFSLAQKNCG